MRPYALTLLVAVLALPVAGDIHWTSAAAGALGGLALALLGVLRPGLSLPRHAGLLAVAAVVPLALLRDGTGGASGGYGVLLVLPVVWVGLHGTRRQLWAVLAAVATALAVPLLVLGAPRYPEAGWRSAPLLELSYVLVGVVVQRLCARQRSAVSTAEVAAATRARLMAVMSDGLIVTDRSGRVLEVNDALCAMTGYAREEVLGTSAPLPSWPASEHERLLAEHAAAVRAGGGRIATHLEHRDGHRLHVVIALAVDRGEPGDEPTVVATVKDVSAEVELHERLERAHARTSAMIGAMGEGFGLTRDGVIVDVNPAICAITGFSREELVGASVPYPFWPPEMVTDLRGVRSRLVADAGGSSELELVRKDGSRFVAEITTVPVHEPDGVAMGFLNTIRDVTARHRAEAERAAHEAELAALVEVTRAVAHAGPDEARRIISERALELAGATTASVWEREPDGTLLCTAMLGAPSASFVLAPTDEDPAVEAVRSGRPAFVADADLPGALDERMARLLTGASVHVQPIVGDDGCMGVLVLSWRTAQRALDDSRANLLELLANEASVAIRRAATHDELERRAHTDALTGLANRRVLEQFLPLRLAAARRNREALAVAIIDLDHFKAYNDAHGHPAGDRLLRTATARWTSRLRESDLLARWGGEEFCVVLANCDAAQAERVLAELRGMLPDGQTFSAGVATSTEASLPDELIARADEALYAAKRAGRARTVRAGRLAPPLA